MAIDRRVARTRAALADALVTLIRRKDYDEITVGDILAEADVGRATFYAHFTSKDDLLRKSLDRLRVLLVAAFEGSPNAPFPRDVSWSPSRALFEHVAMFADVQSALGTARGGAILRAALDEAIANFLRPVLPDDIEASMPRELVILDMVARITTVLRWWLEHRPEISARQAHDALERLVSGETPRQAWKLFMTTREVS